MIIIIIYLACTRRHRQLETNEFDKLPMSNLKASNFYNSKGKETDDASK
jgi:hypothetical protein